MEESLGLFQFLRVLQGLGGFRRFRYFLGWHGILLRFASLSGLGDVNAGLGDCKTLGGLELLGRLQSLAGFRCFLGWHVVISFLEVLPNGYMMSKLLANATRALAPAISRI